MKVKSLHFLFLCMLCWQWVPLSAALPEQPEKKKFRFLINADPQMGPESTEKKGMKILNNLLEDFVSDVNDLHAEKPVDFVVYNGDLVWDPYQDAFDNFTRLVSAQKPPVMLVHGNHDGYDDDPKFFEAQQKLSGYQKLNYTFAFGDWKFVVIGAQEKYRSEELKQKQLQWMRTTLAEYKDDNVMMFMHYHIMPVGLSQPEYYTYWPIDFKNEILDIITEHGNVKYLFNGHVHSGIKGSVKSSVSYKGTNFINSPTPVFGRMFGEEYPGFEVDGAYKRRGFYMEVQVDGTDVQMIGRKIKHKHTERYPEIFTEFKAHMDPRTFVPENRSPFRKKLWNGSFNKNFKGWRKSHRYKKDGVPTFKNIVEKGTNKLHMTASYGSWSFDEYMETYQLVAFDAAQPNVLKYDFTVPRIDRRGAGGYIRLFSYLKDGTLGNMILLHWGKKEEAARNMTRSWAYNAVGDRLSLYWMDQAIAKNQLLSLGMKIEPQTKQLLTLDINAIFQMMHEQQSSKDKINLDDISHIAIAHGVWTRVNQRGTAFKSMLNVRQVSLNKPSKQPVTEPMTLNGNTVDLTAADKKIPFVEFYRELQKKKRQQQTQ